jgi:hypothetical protein
VLPRVLLHVIEPARPVDRATHTRPAAEGSLYDVSDLAVLTIDHIDDARLAERSRVERLPARGRIERGAIEHGLESL